MTQPRMGHIGWLDVTVQDAEKLKSFYEQVVGWKATEVDMGDYKDFVLGPPDSEGVAGICHARGPNDNIPVLWLPYINVANLGESLKQVHALGGKVLRPAARLGTMGRYAIIQDPAGAAAALFEPATAD